MPNKKKILFFIKNLNGGGAERVLLDILSHIDSRKYEITVHCIFNQGVYISMLPDNIKYKYTFKKEFKGFVYLAKLFSRKQLYRFFIKDRYDIEIAFLEGLCTSIISGSNSLAKKVSWLHIDFRDLQILKKPYRSIQEIRDTYNSFDVNVAVSTKAAQSMNTLISGIHKEFEIIHNYIDTEFILTQSKIPQSTVQKNNKIPLLGIVGRLNQAKGHIRLLNVLKRLADEKYQFELLVIGTGEMHSAIKQKIIKSNLSKNIQLLGFQTNPYNLMALLDLHLCVSYYEGFSLVVSEAAALNIPSLVTFDSGLSEMIDDDTKYLIKVENSEAGIYNGLKAFLDNDNNNVNQQYNNTNLIPLIDIKTQVGIIQKKIFNL